MKPHPKYTAQQQELLESIAGKGLEILRRERGNQEREVKDSETPANSEAPPPSQDKRG